jgi:ATP dependent DNA ligase domain
LLEAVTDLAIDITSMGDQTVRNAHNNLKRICAILANPGYSAQRRELEEMQQQQLVGKASLWEPQLQPAVLGNTLSPMISVRSSFQKLMTQTQANHHEYLKKFYHPSTKTHRPLSLQFPALSAEIKLDGERMIVHIQDGRVTMNTRNSKWYSELYSPVLGPCLRKALQKYPCLNVILDGEIESWDGANQRLIPFGENRAVAGYRRAYLGRHGRINPIDENLHDANDVTAMRTANDFFRDTTTGLDEQVARGENFWLKFMAFDILYIQGRDARRLLDDCGLDRVEIGSIITLPLIARKKVLYRILTQQPNEVEICPAVVIRCNGDVVPAEDYFSTTDQMTEYGYPVTLLDSTHATIRGEIPNLEELDVKRQQGRTHAQISRLRAQAMEKFYSKVVEDHKFEGLVVKDLASPYLFGLRKFWWKFKPDYETDEAVDLDVSKFMLVLIVPRKSLSDSFRVLVVVSTSTILGCNLGCHVCDGHSKWRFSVRVSCGSR